MAEDPDFAVVQEGFSWPAFIFNVFWALWHGYWLTAAGIMIIILAIAGLTWLSEWTYVSQLILYCGWFLIVGAAANESCRNHLARAGFAEAGVAFGQNSEEALYSYLKEASLEI